MSLGDMAGVMNDGAIILGRFPVKPPPVIWAIPFTLISLVILAIRL